MIPPGRGAMARAAASPATTGLDCMMTLPLLSVTRSISLRPAPAAARPAGGPCRRRSGSGRPARTAGRWPAGCGSTPCSWSGTGPGAGSAWARTCCRRSWAANLSSPSAPPSA
ncbi:hypothetical protein G6F46_015160 [Rhizopus delemar]|nr:hypothetical protein G6F46_015160 [Rhizopus delemar]